MQGCILSRAGRCGEQMCKPGMVVGEDMNRRSDAERKCYIIRVVELLLFCDSLILDIFHFHAALLILLSHYK